MLYMLSDVLLHMLVVMSGDLTYCRRPISSEQPGRLTASINKSFSENCCSLDVFCFSLQLLKSPSSTSGTANHAVFKVTYITFLPLSDQIDIQQVIWTTLNCRLDIWLVTQVYLIRRW